MVCYLTQTGRDRRKWGKTSWKKWHPDWAWRKCRRLLADMRVDWGEGVEKVLRAKGKLCDQRCERGCPVQVSGSNEGGEVCLHLKLFRVWRWPKAFGHPHHLWPHEDHRWTWPDNWQLSSASCSFVLFCFLLFGFVCVYVCVFQKDHVLPKQKGWHFEFTSCE